MQVHARQDIDDIIVRKGTGHACTVEISRRMDFFFLGKKVTHYKTNQFSMKSF